MLSRERRIADPTKDLPKVRTGEGVESLGDEPVIVPSGPLLVLLPEGTRTVRLNGVSRETFGDDPPVLQVDLTRSVGYHRLELRDRTFWFATQDAKLALDGIAQMLRYLNKHELGTTWSGQVLFTDGRLFRDPHVVYGWLEAHVDLLLSRVFEISRCPLWGSAQEQILSRRGGPGVVPQATHRLLRTNSAQHLEADPKGLLQIGARRYTPLRVVRRHRSATLTTFAHERMHAVLTSVIRLVSEVLRSKATSEVRQVCRDWYLELNRALTSRALRGLPPRLGSIELLGLPMCKEEVVDPRYRRVYETATSLIGRFGWNAIRDPVDRYAHVEYADQIYQAFVGCVLARGFGCAQSNPTIGRGRGPDFVGDRFALHLNREPPTRLLRTWRSHSPMPDRLRPDVVVEHLPDRRVLLIDAKYRSTGDHATEGSRREMLSYMAAYGLHAAVIAYPPGEPNHHEPTTIEGAGQRLVEIPIAPRSGLPEHILAYVADLYAHLDWGRY